jgi:capsule polysaccharide export protein KpsC/LpsZ
MRVQLYTKQAPHHKEWLGHFADGLRKHGMEYDITGDIHTPSIADIFVFWSMRHVTLIDYCRKNSIPFICLERGYIDRMNFASVNLNGLNGRSELNLTEFEGICDRRIKHNWFVKPRIQKGREVIVIGQVNGDASLEGKDAHMWALDALKFFEAKGYAPVFKPHHLDNQRPYGCNEFQGYPIFDGDLNKAIEQACFFVTYSSNAGVDAWLNNVPAVAESPVSMLYKWQTPVGYCLGLNRWLNDLSFRQYNKEEMAKGDAWQILKDRIIPPA